ncbi:YhcN/YlaJ family sporulation lipoprotein [Tumebacillus permanentifrigoris]|uniref:YhcN/YlaJ family sporulation lipoprotein n=1 Tax=Tumebacillus permanentifrigoris TaxID=378543 RepID=A0A316DBH2_9BACL|nr:YhcN/YlaJ family sporulation lipoprotein [Tumebacillus permanentifrigoris]PWK14432.1 YhcN/YlaJ family sporulation lipoprotein [Tumebacillus permanentifrigoris]
MKQFWKPTLCLCLSAALLVGCSPQAAQRQTNETLTDKGMQSYGAYQAPASHRQVVTDTRLSQSGVTTRSAHGLAYELESIPAVKGAAVLVVGRDGYIGITPPQNLQVTAADEQLIRRKVFTLDPTIRSCHITSDPRAVQFLSGYTDALEKGRPLGTFSAQFRAFIDETFPNSPQ